MFSFATPAINPVQTNFSTTVVPLDSFCVMFSKFHCTTVPAYATPGLKNVDTEKRVPTGSVLRLT